MGDPAKQLQSSSLATDLKALFSVLKTRKTKIFVYGFMFAFIACTAFLAFNPSGNAYPWFKFNNPFTFAPSSTSTSSISTYRSQFSSLFSYIFPNSSLASSLGDSVSEIMVDDGVKDGILVENGSDSVVGIGKGGALAGGKQSGNRDTEKSGVLGGNRTEKGALAKDPGKNSVVARKGGALESENQTGSGVAKQGNEVSVKNQTGNGVLGKNQVKQTSEAKPNGVLEAKNNIPSGVSEKNGTEIGVPVSKNSTNAKKEIRVQSQGNVALLKNETTPKKKGISGEAAVANFSASLNGDRSSASTSNGNAGRKEEDWIKSLIGCDIFHGRWVKDESYPLYPPGSCPHIDEPFNCHLNGRPDNAYEKLRWQPNGCKLPRLNASDMLERLRGKRLVFVGDSLNRNMWESLVCILKHSVKDKSKVFEQSGRHEFRTEGSYSFLFRDYGCTIEFFRSPFLVQEWETPDDHGHKKETLRLDIIERSSSKYKDAHVIVFNTGHWWTHEKTSKGKDYYQEGNHVYGNLNVVEAFHKALSTWAKWVDNNVNLKKTLVFFRGYSASHFRGGQWNSGGACDRETEPIKNETYLSSYPPKMNVLESVLKGMKTPVSYLNITRMTDYRKDAHPSVYRKQNLTEEERRSPERYQDCSHWCLPGVPDSWNEILYAQLLIKQYQQQLH